jgi:hypothetical protein
MNPARQVESWFSEMWKTWLGYQIANGTAKGPLPRLFLYRRNFPGVYVCIWNWPGIGGITLDLCIRELAQR